MMNDRCDGGQVPSPPAGLCAGCTHVQVIDTRRGSRFYLCRLSSRDPAFPRYPPTPVRVCRGFVPAPAPDASGG